MKIKILILAVLMLFLQDMVISSFYPTLAYADNSPNQSQAISDANWIMQSVISSGTMTGAIAEYTDQIAIKPYMANYAVIGLARAYQISGNTAYINAAWNYLDWYQNHLDSNDYIHDYDLINGTWEAAPNSQQSTPYDSTDAYAGTYLLAVRATYLADNDLNQLKNLQNGISYAVDAIYSTVQSNGMSWAIPGPSYQVQLLEDNSEAYSGLVAANELAKLLSDNTLSSSAYQYSVNMLNGINTLWNASNSYYYWAENSQGALTAPNWNNLSPDSMEEVWPVSYGIATGNKATILLSQLDSNQPNWYIPTLNGTNYDITLMGWAYYLNGNATQAQTIAQTIRTAMVNANYGWPVTPMSVGELIVLETNGESITEAGQITYPTQSGQSSVPGSGITSPTVSTVSTKASSSSSAQSNTINPAPNLTPAKTIPNKTPAKTNTNKSPDKTASATSPKIKASKSIKPHSKVVLLLIILTLVFSLVFTTRWFYRLTILKKIKKVNRNNS